VSLASSIPVLYRQLFCDEESRCSAASNPVCSSQTKVRKEP
jgi:hypothetical protein